MSAPRNRSSVGRIIRTLIGLVILLAFLTVTTIILSTVLLLQLTGG